MSDADVRAYNAAVAVANLVEVRLVSSSFVAKPHPEADKEGSSATIEDQVRAHQFNEGSGTSFTVFEWKLSGSAASPPTELRLRADFLLVYDGLEGVDAETVERLVRRVGRFASYPYFRAFVSQMGGMGCLELPPLPMLRDQVHASTSVNPNDAPPRRRRRKAAQADNSSA
jgi:hypothetical protein